MNDNRLPKRLLFGDIVQGKRIAGGQYKDYRACVGDNLRKFKLFNDYLEVSQNREEWKTRIKEGLEIHVQEWLKKRE